MFDFYSTDLQFLTQGAREARFNFTNWRHNFSFCITLFYYRNGTMWTWDGTSRTMEACETSEYRRIGCGNLTSLCITGNVKLYFAIRTSARIFFMIFRGNASKCILQMKNQMALCEYDIRVNCAFWRIRKILLYDKTIKVK